MSLSINTSLSTALIAQKLVSREQLAELSTDQNSKRNLPLALITSGLLSEERYLAFCHACFGVPRFDLSEFDRELLFEPVQNRKLIIQHQVLPLTLDGQSLTLVTADPSNSAARDKFEFNSGLPSSLVVCDPVLLHQTIAHLYPDAVLVQTGKQVDLAAENVQLEEVAENHKEYKPDAPIVTYINKVLIDAMNAGASDIHFEPYEHEYRVRFRIDGVLQHASSPPTELATKLAARIKVMANMDIAEKRLPQDGRVKLKLSLSQVVEFRVNSLPTLWGEKMALRLLHSENTNISLNQLGFTSEQKALFEQALLQPQGLILVTGPTGSGKSLSLYTGLNLINSQEKNISTAEDPVEVQLEGINQVQINTKAGLSFATALRAFLRQDPDVIMVGEIRDLETAEIAIKASQTGHLVLSTLHTNSAVETLNRLLNMGIPSYNIVNSLSLIMAQRLVRKLCPHCKTPEISLPESELRKQGFEQEQCRNLTLYKAVGCKKCKQGYKGRVGIFEVIKPNLALNQQILTQPSDIDALLQQQGVTLLRQAGLHKVQQGETSLAEVNRVTSAN